ncbi:restriction endonuclease [Pantoea ananatis]|uniref:restriction endonuclease n=1 Tax=Pantoea ananas TaxID=553 RepID=UPI001B304DC4|nr:restriction endonuclease [Pantoea ananatis]
MKFTPLELKIFNQLFEDSNNAGYVLDFTNKTMREFFESELSIDIDNDIYRKDGDSKIKRLRCLLKQADRETVLRVVTRLWEYRKSIPGGVITAQDDAAYGRFVTKIQGADSLAASGITPILIVPTGIDNDYFLKGLEALHNQKPHQRGHSFELWLNELFTAFYLSPKGAFRLKGEQIDGSFLLNNETYLVEAKWHSTKTGNADLHAFHGKLDQKISWARGVFISWAGFTRSGLDAWGRGKKVICVSGYDLVLMLKNNISFRMLMEEKIRRAAETGNLYVKIDEIYPNISK